LTNEVVTPKIRTTAAPGIPRPLDRYLAVSGIQKDTKIGHGGSLLYGGALHFQLGQEIFNQARLILALENRCDSG
jgi:hypothetical protein